MKSIVIYSSKTGNTAKVARAVASELGCEAVKFDENLSVNLSEFDFVAVGFYVDKGDVEVKFKEFLGGIKGKKMGVFMTLGMDPEHEHAKDCLNKAKVVLEQNGNEIVREFFCQGAVDPVLIEQMRKMGETDPRFAVTPEREERWARAAKHPDENDLAKAKEAFRGIEI